ncbi:hypothetical protein EDB86DRAFT_1288813 [Lactarius hatsudake]|nr:hypothetical protein EDB86DRAFT_1288813 [Lactarius hatsudake]
MRTTLVGREGRDRRVVDREAGDRLAWVIGAHGSSWGVESTSDLAVVQNVDNAALSTIRCYAVQHLYSMFLIATSSSTFDVIIPHLLSNPFSTIICSLSLLSIDVALMCAILVFLRIVVTINYVGRVVYSDEIMQYRQGTHQLGLGSNRIFLGDNQDLETPLHDSKYPLDDIPELCVTKVEQLLVILRSTFYCNLK